MKKLFLPFLGLLWACLVFYKNQLFFQYAWQHLDAFQFDSLTGLWQHTVLPITTFLFISLLAWVLGRALLYRFGLWENTLFSHCLALGLGVGLIGEGLFILGLCQGYSVLGLTVFISVLIFSAFVLLPSEKPFLKSIPIGKIEGPWQSICLFILAFSTWHIVLAALAPPGEWDILAYHLAIPKLYWKAGGIYEIPWLLHSHWPHLGEVLYTLPLAVHQEALAALLHAGITGLAIAALAWIVRRDMDAPTAWGTAALMSAQPIYLQFAGSAHADGFQQSFYILSSLCAWQWTFHRSKRWLIVAGIFAGLAASSKMTGLALMGLLALSISLVSARWKSRIQSAAVFMACGLAIVFPWYIKTWVGAGNPFWPFMSSVFGGRWGGPLLEKPYLKIVTWQWNHPDTWSSMMTFSPQFLLLPLFLLLVWASFYRPKLPPLLRFLLIPAVGYTIFVSNHCMIWRFIWPIWATYVLLFIWLIRFLWQGHWLQKVFVTAAFAFALIPLSGQRENESLFAVSEIHSTRWPDKTPREAFLLNTLEHYAFYKQIEASTTPEDRILLFQEIRGYYLDRPYQWGDPFNQGLLHYDEFPDSKALGHRLRELGMTHVFCYRGSPVYQPNNHYYTNRTLALMHELLQTRADLILTKDGMELYRLRPML